MAKDFTQLSLPKESVTDFLSIKIAFSYLTGKIYTNGEVVAELISSLEKSNPAVYNIYRNIKKSDNTSL